MTKSLDQKLAELNDRPVPDETLTKAWWDLREDAKADASNGAPQGSETGGNGEVGAEIREVLLPRKVYVDVT